MTEKDTVDAASVRCLYTVWCTWPSAPERLRLTVAQAKEKTGRDSVEALLKMKYAVCLDVSLYVSDLTDGFLGHVGAATWDTRGRLVKRYDGKFQQYMPSWVLGTEPVIRDVPSGNRTAGS